MCEINYDDDDDDQECFLAIMTHAKFHFNRLMSALISGIWFSEPPGACQMTEKVRPDRVNLLSSVTPSSVTWSYTIRAVTKIVKFSSNVFALKTMTWHLSGFIFRELILNQLMTKRHSFSIELFLLVEIVTTFEQGVVICKITDVTTVNK